MASRMTGSASASFLTICGSSTSSGRSPRTRPTASRTSFAASSTLRSISNSMTVRLRPRRLCELIDLTPLIPATAPLDDLGDVGLDDLGAAPLYSVVTVMTAASMSGSSRNGMRIKDAMPNTTINRQTTVARTGLRMLRSERVIWYLPPARPRSTSRGPLRRRAGVASRRRRRIRSRRRPRSVRPCRPGACRPSPRGVSQYRRPR